MNRHILSLLKSNKAYTVHGRYPNKYIEFDGTNVYQPPFHMQIFIDQICDLVNAGYFEGYLQREREAQVEPSVPETLRMIDSI